MALSASAMAADPAIVAPGATPPPPMFTWGGAYVGVFGGLGTGNTTAANDPTVLTGGAFDEGNIPVILGLTPRGVLGGVTLGYNYQSGKFVVGAEAAGGFLGLNDTFTINTNNTDGDGNLLDDEGTVGYGWYATLSGRIGVALDRTLVYATAGGIVAQYTATYADLDGGATDPTDATTLTGPQWGYLVGGGAEFAFDANWTARLEYNYFNLGTDTTTNTDGDVFIHRNSAHLIRFGLNFLLPN
jgi:outer membrane immunogenic protein